MISLKLIGIYGFKRDAINSTSLLQNKDCFLIKAIKRILDLYFTFGSKNMHDLKTLHLGTTGKGSRPFIELQYPRSQSICFHFRIIFWQSTDLQGFFFKKPSSRRNTIAAYIKQTSPLPFFSDYEYCLDPIEHKKNECIHEPTYRWNRKLSVTSLSPIGDEIYTWMLPSRASLDIFSGLRPST